MRKLCVDIIGSYEIHRKGGKPLNLKYDYDKLFNKLVLHQIIQLQNQKLYQI